ncbi:MAG TPA: formylmethanofuran dehydrogenase subunit C [Alphaproteobacteria bacterium]|jgi:formylmethanofuran dehydrogenase subunit C|nr:formylmethanofuran dehydrogenase subunit C [Alphaproteobacteria bacterium]
MEGWKLTLRNRPPLPVEVGCLSPETLAHASAAKLERIPLWLGRRTVALADLFRVEGGPGPLLVLAGACERLDGIGRGLVQGEIRVDADAGYGTGASQSGGSIHITGSVGDHAAAGMRGGMLTIEGGAGSFLGGPPPGARLGMRGGLVIVRGGAGPRAGERMRRGTILITGDAGDCCGARMVAGTVAVGGGLGASPGLRMRRGTILASRAVQGIPDTFVQTGQTELTILSLLACRLRHAAPWLAPLITGRPMRRASGDLAVDGRGEILLSEPIA